MNITSINDNKKNLIVETYTVRYPEEIHISRFTMTTKGGMSTFAQHWILDTWGEILQFKQVDYLDKFNDKLIKSKLYKPCYYT